MANKSIRKKSPKKASTKCRSASKKGTVSVKKQFSLDFTNTETKTLFIPEDYTVTSSLRAAINSNIVILTIKTEKSSRWTVENMVQIRVEIESSVLKCANERKFIYDILKKAPIRKPIILENSKDKTKELYGYSAYYYRDINDKDRRYEEPVWRIINISKDLELYTTYSKNKLAKNFSGFAKSETASQIFARVAVALSYDVLIAQRKYLYNYARLFVDATPNSLSAGNPDDRVGHTISCFTQALEDNMESIISLGMDGAPEITRIGGGLATYVSNCREAGASIGDPNAREFSSGPISFMKAIDCCTTAVRQGRHRRGVGAFYMRIDHPDIYAFCNVRKNSGSESLRIPNTHIAVIFTKKFLQAVINDTAFELISPHSKKVVQKVSARELFNHVISARYDTGQPFVFYNENVHNMRPLLYKALGLTVETSNLCTEIMLATGRDHLGNKRNGVCCLGSINVEQISEIRNKSFLENLMREFSSKSNAKLFSDLANYKPLYDGNTENKDSQYIFMEDILSVLDISLQSFIDETENNEHKSIIYSRYSAIRERSIGVGYLGLHSYYHRVGAAFDDMDFTVKFERELFKGFKNRAMYINFDRGEIDPCPDSLDAIKNISQTLLKQYRHVRWTHMFAVAPNSTSAEIVDASYGVEPIRNMVFRTNESSTHIKISRYFQKVIDSIENEEKRRMFVDEVKMTKGKIQNIDLAKYGLSEHLKYIYKDASEIDPAIIIRKAGIRQPYLCQAQSINIVIPTNIPLADLLMIHLLAYTAGVKTLYYLRTEAPLTATAGGSIDSSKSLDAMLSMVTDDSESEHYSDRGNLDKTEDICLTCAN